jgi:hypothetical protein
MAAGLLGCRIVGGPLDVLMQRVRTNSPLSSFRALVLIAALAAALVAGVHARALAEESEAYVVEISDVSAKVGEPAVMVATLKVRDGYRILKSYNNRVISLSSFDDGVTFDRKMVPATVQEEALVFAVGLRATKPGKHPINGIFRVGYIHGTEEFAMVSVRLIANVTGTE